MQDHEIKAFAREHCIRKMLDEDGRHYEWCVNCVDLERVLKVFQDRVVSVAKAKVLRRSAEEIENAMKNREVKLEELINWYRAQAENFDPQKAEK